MGDSVIPVDVHNPGQVFGCLGLMELSEVLLGGTMAAFDWRNGNPVFRLTAAGPEPPVARALSFLAEADIAARVPAGIEMDWKKHWGPEPEQCEPNEPFPLPVPEYSGRADTIRELPIIFRDDAGHQMEISYWCEQTRRTGRDAVKFWAGSEPGIAIVREVIMKPIADRLMKCVADPFSLAMPQSNSLRFDWRRDYVPREIGFSLNNHKGKMGAMGFPLVDVLAAIGLTYARPMKEDKKRYVYGILGQKQNDFLEPTFHRVSLGGDRSPLPGNPFRRFVMNLESPDGKIKCITEVFEQGGN